MPGYMSDAAMSDDDQVDIGRMHSQAMVIGKRGPSFLEGSKLAVGKDIKQLLDSIEQQRQTSDETQEAFHSELDGLVQNSLQAGQAQMKHARSLIATGSPLEQLVVHYSDAEEILRGVQLRDLAATYNQDREQTIDVLAAGKRVFRESLAGIEGQRLKDESEIQAARIFDVKMGEEVQRVSGEVEYKLRGIESMVKKSTKMIPLVQGGKT